MARALMLGNGEMLVGMDEFGLVRDVYYPYVGLEDHVGSGHVHLVGVWVDGSVAWLDGGAWQVKVATQPGTLEGETRAINEKIGIELLITDVVYNEKNVLVRKVEIKNRWDKNREIRLYFGQQFEISGAIGGDTAFFEPKRKLIIHYKGKRVFGVNAMCEDNGFDDYSVGIFGMEGREGTHRDAEDGKLAKNPIEHGQVDSVVGLTIKLAEMAGKTVYYWLAAASSLREVYQLNDYVLVRHPQHLIKTTRDYWSAWVNKQKFTFFKLEKPVVELFKKSLLFIRSQVDNRGGIIASGDSNMIFHGRDTYSYVWPRDGAFTAMALVRAGDLNLSRRFFEFCNNVVTDEGYFMHKYRPDESMGSSWHSWVRENKFELPIQEDETAIVLIGLWEYYRASKDLEFVEQVYNSLVRRSTEFMLRYINFETGLPFASYDLWEEKYGVSTYTCASVYGALIAAAKFAKTLGKTDNETQYSEAAKMVKTAILKYLYDPDKGFLKMVGDTTIDASSVIGVVKFGVLDAIDPRVNQAMSILKDKLMLKDGVGGVVRYVGDNYYRVNQDAPSNPWFVTTLWYVQYLITLASEEKDFDEVKKWLEWTTKHANYAGMLAEQINPYTGEGLSVAPLTWSHAELVLTIVDYLEKVEELGIGNACYITT